MVENISKEEEEGRNLHVWKRLRMKHRDVIMNKPIASNEVSIKNKVGKDEKG